MNEIQIVYRLQGVTINDKHIEIIIRQMLRKVNVILAGDSKFLVGEQVELVKVLEENDVLRNDNKLLVDFLPVLLGIVPKT